MAMKGKNKEFGWEHALCLYGTCITLCENHANKLLDTRNPLISWCSKAVLFSCLNFIQNSITKYVCLSLFANIMHNSDIKYMSDRTAGWKIMLTIILFFSMIILDYGFSPFKLYFKHLQQVKLFVWIQPWFKRAL